MNQNTVWLVLMLLSFIGVEGQTNFDIDSINKSQLSYNTFSARTKCNWTTKENTTDFQCSLRMIKDSIIWGSITGPMSIEAARFLITPDTFRLLSAVSKEYMVREMRYVMRWLALPFTFQQIQQLLFGSIVQTENDLVTFFQDSLQVVIYSENAQLQTKTMVDPVNYNITSIVLKDKMLNQQMQITFGQPDLKSGKWFYPQRTITILQGKEEMKLQLDFTRCTLDETLNFPFEPTSGYKRIE